MKYGVNYTPAFHPDPQQVAELIRRVGLTREDLMQSVQDGGEQMNDRILCCFAQGPFLMPRLERSGLLASYTLVFPPRTTILGDWGAFWRQALDHVDKSTTPPTYAGVHGQMTFDDYMDVLSQNGVPMYTREDLLAIRHDGYVRSREGLTFAEFIQGDQWLGGLREMDKRDPSTGEKIA